jgi:UDP-N-acetylglucosamine transferase subunit ALG13
MVSKSKILGRRNLIVLISKGTTQNYFYRIDNYFKSINDNQYKIINEFQTPSNLIKLIKTADKIIAHGGLATIFLLTKYAKYMPLIIPRLAKYKEHVDDHQLHFVKFLRKKVPKKLKKYFIIKEKIKNDIENYLNEKKIENQLKKFLFLNKRKNMLIKKLKDYINL